MRTTCGIFLYDLNYHCVLIGHITNSKNRYSIPKGEMSVDERNYYDCAKREFHEETNIDIDSLNILFKREFDFINYEKNISKKLKSFLIITRADIDNDEIRCNSSFMNKKLNIEQPEIDFFKWCDLNTASKILPISQKKLIPEISNIVSNIYQFE